MLSAADRDASPGPEELSARPWPPTLWGRDAESFDSWARAHQAFLGEGEAPARRTVRVLAGHIRRLIGFAHAEDAYREAK